MLSSPKPTLILNDNFNQELLIEDSFYKDHLSQPLKQSEIRSPHHSAQRSISQTSPAYTPFFNEDKVTAE